MKPMNSYLSIVYHLTVTFKNGKSRHMTFYNADNFKDAIRYFENKYGSRCEISTLIEYL